MRPDVTLRAAGTTAVFYALLITPSPVVAVVAMVFGGALFAAAEFA